MQNLRAKVNPSAFDMIVEITTILLTIISFAWPMIYSNKVMGKIPTHYNLLGEADKWSQQPNAIWILPVIGLIIFILLSVLNRFPFLYRYPIKVTASNAEYLYTLGTTTVVILKMLIAGAFLCLTLDNVGSGTNQTYNLSRYGIPFFLLASTLLLSLMILKMRTAKI